MTKEVSYREFHLRDLPQVLDIEREAFPLPLSGLALLFLSASCRFYVAEADRIAGYLILGNDNRNTLFIHHIASHKDYRSLGIGAELLRRYVHPRPCRVTVRASNTRAIQFYEAHDFHPLQTYEKLHDGLEDLVLLEHPGGPPAPAGAGGFSTKSGGKP